LWIEFEGKDKNWVGLRPPLPPVRPPLPKFIQRPFIGSTEVGSEVPRSTFPALVDLILDFHRIFGYKIYI
jgi:hypothetical protein